MTKKKIDYPENQKKSGPIGFWFLNDEIKPKNLKTQLDHFAEKGFSGVVFHPRYGLPVPYLSDQWFEILKLLLDECRKRNINAWFYDEYQCPSGCAGGLILDQYPHLKASTLTFIDETICPKNGIIQRTFPEVRGLLKAFAIPVDDSQNNYTDLYDITSHMGLISTQWYVQGKREIGYGPSFVNDISHPHWRAWQQKKTWALSWNIHTERPMRIIIVYYNRANSSEGHMLTDMLVSETSKRFIELTHERTKLKLGDEMFREFVAVFSDEPGLMAPYPWTHILPNEYKKKYNEDLLSLLPHLKIDFDITSEQVRYRYRRLLGELFYENFGKPVAKYCNEQNIPLTGHISPEEDPIVSSLCAPGFTNILSLMDWPGFDLITLPFGENESSKLLGPKLISSIAHQQDKEHLMTEAFGCCGEDLTIKQMHRITNWLAVFGFDTFILHGQFMSLDGHRKREAPPSIFYQMPYWEYFDEFTKYIQEIGSWNCKGQPYRPIAVLHPNSAFESWSMVKNNEAAALAQNLAKLIEKMMSAGLDFDLVTDYDLSKASIITQENSQKIKVGKAIYDTLILPDVSILDEYTHKTLIQAQKAGVHIESLTKSIRLIGDKTPMYDCCSNNITINALIKKLIDKYRQWLQVGTRDKVYVQSRINNSKLERMIWNPNQEPVSILLYNIENPYISTFDNSEPISVSRIGKNIQVELYPMQMVILENLSEDAKIKEIPPLIEYKSVKWSKDWLLIPEKDNTLLLSKWLLELKDGTTHLVTVPTNSNTPLCITSEQTVKMSCKIIVDQTFDNAQLWWDKRTFSGNYEIYINGQITLQPENISINDINERKINIGHLIHSGINTFELNIGPIKPGQLPMLDPLRLQGNFQVVQIDKSDNTIIDVRPAWYREIKPDNPFLSRICLSNKDIYLSHPVDWTKLGYPQYSGAMTYRGCFIIQDDINSNFFIDLGYNQHDAVSISVNSKRAGITCWNPFRVEITELIRKGENILDLRVCNTSINRSEGEAKPSGVFEAPKIMVYDIIANERFQKFEKDYNFNCINMP